VSRDELHAATLYQSAGEELIVASAANADLRQKVIAILSDRMDWGRIGEIEQSLESPESAADLAHATLPTDSFFLLAQFRRRYPEQAAEFGPAGRELDDLVKKNPADTGPERIATDFGVPHPTFADSDALALLIREPFPVSGGFTNRLFGESWESGNLYWARLADEKGYSPAMLNLLVPELTGRMIANISATSIDDWPALMRAMAETGGEFRRGELKARPADLIAGGINTTDREELAR